MVLALYQVSGAPLQPTRPLHIRHWRRLLLALVRGSSLVDVFPDDLLGLTHADVALPTFVGAEAGLDIGEDAPPCIAHHARIKCWLQWLQASWDSMLGHVAWYRDRLEDISQALHWLDGEVTPVLLGLVDEIAKKMENLDEGEDWQRNATSYRAFLDQVSQMKVGRDDALVEEIRRKYEEAKHNVAMCLRRHEHTKAPDMSRAVEDLGVEGLREMLLQARELYAEEKRRAERVCEEAGGYLSLREEMVRSGGGLRMRSE